MKNLKIISNLRKDFKDFKARISGILRPSSPSVFFFSAFISFAAGIILWYQYENYYLFLITPFLPLLLSRLRNFFLLLSFCLFFLLLGNLRASYVPPHGKGTVQGTGVISSIPKEYDFYKKANIEIKTASAPIGKSIEARFEKHTSPVPGDEIRFAGNLKQPVRYRNFSHSPAFSQRFEEERVYLGVKELETTGSIPFMHSLFELRKFFISAVSEYPGAGVAFFKEVLFGSNTLPQKERDIFAAGGAAHILSISGLHFALTVLFAYFIVYAIQLIYPGIVNFLPRPALTVIFSLPLLVFYAFLSGLSVPAARSFIIFLLGAGFFLLKKAVNPFSLLSLIAFLFLLFDQAFLFSLSFQLSFICVFVLVTFYGEIKDILGAEFIARHPVPYYFAGIAASSFLISLFIFPITQTLSPQSFVSGILANPVVIPLFSFLVLPFLLLSLPVALISQKLFHALLFIPETGWNLIYYYLSFIQNLTAPIKLNLFFDFRTAVVYYIFLVAIFKARGRLRLTALAAGIVAVALSLPSAPKDSFVSFMDVGQGDAALIRTKTGKIIFIDTGGNTWDPALYGRAYRPFLNTLPAKEIEAVFISHAHPDHWKTLPELAKQYAVKHAYLPADSDDSIKLPDAVQRHVINKTTDINIDGIEFRLLPSETPARSPNNNSMWVVMTAYGATFLFTGDTEKKYIPAMVENLPDLKNTPVIVKVPHHGAKSSFDTVLYEKLNPLYAVISVGDRNPWKLPSESVLAFFRKKNIKTLRTDKNGQIMFTAQPDGETVPMPVRVQMFAY